MKKALLLTITLLAVLSIFASTAETVGFTEEHRLTTYSGYDERPGAVSYNDYLYVAWHSDRDGNRDIYYKIFDGSIWSESNRLTYDTARDVMPSLAVFDEKLFAAWYSDRDGDMEIYYKTYNGTEWSEDIQITHNTIEYDEVPNMCVYKDKLYLFFNRESKPDARDDEVYYKTFDGSTWSTEVKLTEYSPEKAEYSSCAVYKGLLYVAYQVGVDFPFSSFEVYYKVFDGSTWSADTRLTSNNVRDCSPTLGVYRNELCLAWCVYPEDNFEICYRTFDGSTWMPENTLVSNPADDQSPNLAVFGDSLYLFFSSDRDDPDRDIYYKIVFPSTIATVNIDPDTLNLKSGGSWITAYIELPEGYDVNDINVSTILLNDTIPAELHPTEVGDYDNDTIPDLMVKFDRADVIEYILNTTAPEPDKFVNVTLTVTGKQCDETPFEGSDTIKAIIPALIGRGWGIMQITPEERVSGRARLFKMEDRLIQLAILHEDEEYSRTWEIIRHEVRKHSETYLCYNEEWGFLVVRLHQSRRCRFWYAVGRGVAAFGPPTFEKLKLMPPPV